RKLFGGFVRLEAALGDLPPGPGGLRALVRLAALAVARARGPRPGPVHIDIPPRKPLEPSPSCAATRSGHGMAAPHIVSSVARASEAGLALARDVVVDARRPLVVVGPAPAQDRAALAEAVVTFARATGAAVA